MARKLHEAIDDIVIVARYFGFNIKNLKGFRDAARIEIHMTEKVSELIKIINR